MMSYLLLLNWNWRIEMVALEMLLTISIEVDLASVACPNDSNCSPSLSWNLKMNMAPLSSFLVEEPSPPEACGVLSWEMSFCFPNLKRMKITLL